MPLDVKNYACLSWMTSFIMVPYINFIILHVTDFLIKNISNITDPEFYSIF